MKIAITYENGKIFQHFGQTKQFKIYDIDGRIVKSAAIADVGEVSHCKLAGLLKQIGVEVLICGGIGMGAKNALEAEGIAVCAGVEGSADTALDSFIAQTLAFSSCSTCSHHAEGHSCGHHHDDEHSCGGSCR